MKPMTAKLREELREQAAQEGRLMARTVFARRGNRSEAHLSERGLASALGAAFEIGFEQGRALGDVGDAD